jgi:pilus assembly protein CpaC
MTVPRNIVFAACVAVSLLFSPIGKADAPAVFGRQNHDARIELQATTEVWVAVHDQAGQQLFERLMKPGERYRVPNRPDLLLDTGNIKGLTISVDGGSAMSMPRRGTSIVERNHPLDPPMLLPAVAMPEAPTSVEPPLTDAAVPPPKVKHAKQVAAAPHDVSVPPISEAPTPVPRPAIVKPSAAVPPERVPVAKSTKGLTDASSTTMELEIGKGTLLRLKGPAATVFVANPDTADVQVKSPTLVYVFAKAPGETVLYAVDEQERVLYNGTIHVTQNLGRLRQSLAELLPDEPITVESLNGSLVLSGNVASATRAEDARALAQSFVDEKKYGTVLNHIAVITPNQVNLRVRIAEVDRNTLKEFGINWNTLVTSSRFAFGLVTQNPTAIGGIASANTASGAFTASGVNIDSIIDALAQEGLITMLAEPNLTALSGQTASFLAGGEFPIPVGSTSLNGVPTITIDFKKFGVSLEFTPTILDSKRVNMRVRPEVSQLSTTAAVVSQGISIPGLTVRRAETSIELGSGESFAIAGLLQNNAEHDISKVPALGDVPVLGALFRSDRFQRNETELVIIVTPYLVRPTNAVALALPTDGLGSAPAGDRIVRGGESPAGAVGPQANPKHSGQGLIGPAGFSFE